jgi:competence protein ComEC
MELWKIGIISSISILLYNILHIPLLFMVIIAIVLAGGFIYFEDKRKYIIYAFIFIVYQIISGLFIFNQDIKEGNIYSVKAKFNGKNIVVSSIEGKSSIRRIILKESSENKLKGRGELLIRADKLEKSKNTDIILCEIIEIRKGVFDRIRDYLSEKIKKISENKDVYGIVGAVILGDESELTDEIKKGFRYTGTAHIIVISGLHIGIIIITILKIADLLKMRYKQKYILSLMILTFYCFIVGMTPPVARSYIMGVIYLMSKIMWEKSETDKSFWIAYIGILFFNPAQLYSISFQLSFGAIFSLIYIFELIKNREDNFFIEMLKMSFIIQIVLSPFFIMYFGTFPILSIFANIIVIPIGIVMVQIMFGAVFITAISPIFDRILKIILEYLVEILIFYIKLFEKIPFMQIEVNSGAKVIVVIAYILFSLAVVHMVMKNNKKREEDREKSKELKIF